MLRDAGVHQDACKAWERFERGRRCVVQATTASSRLAIRVQLIICHCSFVPRQNPMLWCKCTHPDPECPKFRLATARLRHFSRAWWNRRVLCARASFLTLHSKVSGLLALEQVMVRRISWKCVGSIQPKSQAALASRSAFAKQGARSLRCGE